MNNVDKTIADIDISVREFVRRLGPNNIKKVIAKLAELSNKDNVSVQVPPVICALAAHSITHAVCILADEEDSNSLRYDQSLQN